MLGSGEGLNTPDYRSWRKLQLSRSKLQASTKISAVMASAVVRFNVIYLCTVKVKWGIITEAVVSKILP
jgi:hypothetical protein